MFTGKEAHIQILNITTRNFQGLCQSKNPYAWQISSFHFQTSDLADDFVRVRTN
jgi:hypothetical protein